MKRIRLHACLVGIVWLLLVLGGCGGGGGGGGGGNGGNGGGNGETGTVMLPEAGGSVSSGDITITAPPQAVAADTEVNVRSLAAAELPGVEGVVECTGGAELDGPLVALDKPVVVELPLLSEAAPGTEVDVYYQDDDGVYRYAGCGVVGPAGDSAIVGVTRLSNHAVAPLGVPTSSASTKAATKWGICTWHDHMDPNVLQNPEKRALEELCGAASGEFLIKFWLNWSDVEAGLSPLRAEEVPSPTSEEAEFEGWVQDYVGGMIEGRAVTWDKIEREIGEVHRCGGVPFPWVCDGAPDALPWRLEAGDVPITIQGTPVRINPDNITGASPNDSYRHNVALFVAALAHKFGNEIPYWNLENEWNWIPSHLDVPAVCGGPWRYGESWRDRDFRESLFLTMADQVAQQQKKSVLHVNITPLAALPGREPWLAWVRDPRDPDLLKKTDIIGLGDYGCYHFTGTVVEGMFDPLVWLQSTVQAARTAAGENELWLAEIGYPSTLQSSEIRQALYLYRLNDRVVPLVDALVYFKLSDRKPDEDSPICIPEALDAEAHWGLLRADGSKKPAFGTFKRMVSGEPLINPIQPQLEAIPAAASPGESVVLKCTAPDSQDISAHVWTGMREGALLPSWMAVGKEVEWQAPSERGTWTFACTITLVGVSLDPFNPLDIVTATNTISVEVR